MIIFIINYYFINFSYFLMSIIILFDFNDDFYYNYCNVKKNGLYNYNDYTQLKKVNFVRSYYNYITT